jgi:hypothetical protein
MRYFIREMLHKKRLGIEEFINKDPSVQARIVKITMILKSLSFNRKILEDNFDPYIKDTIIETVSIIKRLLAQIPADSSDVSFVTYANLLQALTFDTHPSVKTDKIHGEFMKLDQEVYMTILENIFILLNQAGASDARALKNDLMITVFSLRSYIYYEQARIQVGAQDQAIVENIVQQNDLIREIYNALILKTLQVLD